jgi:hypothetical protein
MGNMEDRNLIDIFKEFWEYGAAAVAFVTGLVAWRLNKTQSVEMLFEQYEVLKQKVIARIPKEMEDALTIARQKALLKILKEVCPDCYEKAMEQTDSIFDDLN